MENFIEGIVPLLRHKPKMKSVVTNYVPLRHLLKANIKAIHFRSARRMLIFSVKHKSQHRDPLENEYAFAFMDHVILKGMECTKLCNVIVLHSQ